MLLADIIRERLDALHNEVGQNRIYLISQVNADALYFLAEQFDVLGYKGWFLANTEEQRRELIRRAIELHRYKGTPWSVKEAIKQLGFTDVNIIERVELINNFYNGTISYNGSETYGAGTGDWATFSVIINASDWSDAVNPLYITALKELIFEYKGARNHLIDLVFHLDFEDSMEMVDVTDLDNVIGDEDTLTGFSLMYDGTATYGGEYDYDETGDALDVIVSAVEPSDPIEIEFASGGFDEVAIGITAASATIDWGDGSPTDTVMDDTLTYHTYSGTDARTASVAFTGITGIEVYLNENQIVSFSYLPLTLERILLNIFGGTSLDFELYTNLEYLLVVASPSLTSVVIPEVASLTYVHLENNALTTVVLNEILITLDAAGAENGYVNIADNAGAADGDGITAAINLVLKGWTLIQ